MGVQFTPSLCPGWHPALGLGRETAFSRGQSYHHTLLQLLPSTLQLDFKPHFFDSVRFSFPGSWPSVPGSDFFGAKTAGLMITASLSICSSTQSPTHPSVHLLPPYYTPHAIFGATDMEVNGT